MMELLGAESRLHRAVALRDHFATYFGQGCVRIFLCEYFLCNAQLILGFVALSHGLDLGREDFFPFRRPCVATGGDLLVYRFECDSFESCFIRIYVVCRVFSFFNK